MDIIVLKGIEVPTIIGVYSWEQRISQRLLVDLELAVDISQAANSDDLHHTIDYEALTQRVISFGQSNQCHLLESFAENLSSLLKREFQITWLRLSVTKPAALEKVKEVKLVIERE